MGKLRTVKVTYDNGDVIKTNMAGHLTDEQIYDYFAIGREFNAGDGPRDLMAKVVDVEILRDLHVGGDDDVEELPQMATENAKSSLVDIFESLTISRRRPINEGTSNFYNKNASKIFAIEIEDELDYDDAVENVKDSLSREIDGFDAERGNNFDTERHFTGNTLGSVSVLLDDEYPGDPNSGYYEEGETYEYEVIVSCVLRSGYYRGANLDWEVTVYENGNEIGDADDFEPAAGSDAETEIRNTIDTITEEIEKVYAQYSEPLRVSAQFSSGETWYEKDKNESKKMKNKKMKESKGSRDFPDSFANKSLLENYNRMIKAKNRRLNDSEPLLGDDEDKENIDG